MTPCLERIAIGPRQWISGEQATLSEWKQALDFAALAKDGSLRLQRHISGVLVRRAAKIGARDGEPLFPQLARVDGIIRSMNQAQRDRRSAVLAAFQKHLLSK
jgi:hypothetical protein